MQKFNRLWAALALLSALASFAPEVRAQGCGPSNPNCIVPTAPVGTSNNQAASTAFVQQNGGYTGLSGDCTATSLGVITCVKTNGTPFGTMAVQNANGVAITGGSITGMPNPSASSDVATKNYVDSLASGIVVLAPSGLATAAVLPNAPTYANGALGVGATLTAGSNTTLTVDGTAAPLNTVVLVKNQASAFQNGIYTVTQAGSGAAPWILTRATYFDQAAEMKAGSYTFITGGTTNAGNAYTLQTAVTTVGTDPLNWLLFSQGSGSVGAGGTIIASRAAAAAQNLSAFTTIRTLGYASPGDGGGANFVKVGGATPFKDSYITAATLVGGSLYTNGTYKGVPFGGGTGLGCGGGAVVSGAVVSSVQFLMPCAGYAVGDVLTPSNSTVGGTGSGATWTVTSVSTPMASFTDAAGNRWQYVVDAAAYPNLLQFGAKADWNGVDGGATDNYNAFMSAFAFSLIPFSQSVAQVYGHTLNLPKGGFMYCLGTPVAASVSPYTLPVPQGVALVGLGVGATTLKQCGGAANDQHSVTLCDTTNSRGQFTCSLRHMTVISDAASSSGVALIYSRSGQQAWPLLDYVELQPTLRACLKYELGVGGAASAIFQNVDCQVVGTARINALVYLDSSGTQIRLQNFTMECGPTAVPVNCGVGVYGVNITKGNVIIDTLHCESIDTCIFMNSTGDITSIRNVTSTANCQNGVTLSGSNTPGNALIENFTGACAVHVLTNNQGGANINTAIVNQIRPNP